MEITPKVLNHKQACIYLQMGKELLHTYRRKGIIKAVPYGQGKKLVRWMYRVAELDRFLKAAEIEQTPVL